MARTSAPLASPRWSQRCKGPRQVLPLPFSSPWRPPSGGRSFTHVPVSITQPVRVSVAHRPMSSSAARTKARNSFLLFSSTRKENSGCHWTAHTKRLSGIYAASMNPSGATAMADHAGASPLTA